VKWVKLYFFNSLPPTPPLARPIHPSLFFLSVLSERNRSTVKKKGVIGGENIGFLFFLSRFFMTGEWRRLEEKENGCPISFATSSTFTHSFPGQFLISFLGEEEVRKGVFLSLLIFLTGTFPKPFPRFCSQSIDFHSPIPSHPACIYSQGNKLCFFLRKGISSAIPSSAPLLVSRKYFLSFFLTILTPIWEDRGSWHDVLLFSPSERKGRRHEKKDPPEKASPFSFHSKREEKRSWKVSPSAWYLCPLPCQSHCFSILSVHC